MTVHERMDALADLLVAGGLGADERAEAERHAADCAACAALIRDARDFAAWAKGAIRPDGPPADLEDRVIGRFRAAGQVKRRRFIVGTRVLKLTGSIAAAVGLIFLGNLFSQQSAIGGDQTRLAKGLSSIEADYRATDRHWSDSSATRLAERALEKDSWDGSLAILEYKQAELGRDRKVLEDGLAKNGDDGKRRSTFRAGELQLERERLSQIEVEKSIDELRGANAPMMDARKVADVPKPDAKSEPAANSLPPTPAPAPEPMKQRMKHGEPQVSTLAVGVDELDVKASVAGGAERGNEEKPATLAAKVQDVRKIIRTAEVALEVDSYDATYTKLSDLMTAEKGLVSSASTQKAANGKIQATVILRVPPERFETVLAKLKDFGTVRSQNVDSEDVTKAYVDLETRLKSKEILAERLRKLLSEGKGNVKELMEVEVQLGATNEAIEGIKGEIKYYDNRIALSSLTLQIAEKDLGQPFEVVQTLQANLALTVRDPDDAYAKAQKEIADAGGQVVDSRMNRQNDGSSTGTIRARVDADKFQALREALKKLGVPTNDTVNQQKIAQGGLVGTPKADAPLRKEQAVLDLSVTSPPIFVTRRLQLVVETPEVEAAYGASRKSVEGVGGKVLDGSLMGKTDRMVGVLKIQADADKFGALTESLKTAGKVKSATVSSVLPATAADGGAALLRERAEIEFTLASPPQLIAEENGLGKSIRDTLANSWSGLLWSIEKLFVGLSLAGPWVLLLAAGIFGWKRWRKPSATRSP